MERRQFILALLAAAVARPAAAAALEDNLVSQLKSQGFTTVDVNTTWLGRVRIVASNDSFRREIVMNPRTGEILRDYQEAISDAADTAIRLTNSGSDSGRGSGSGGSGNGGSGNGGSGNGGSGGGQQQPSPGTASGDGGAATAPDDGEDGNSGTGADEPDDSPAPAEDDDPPPASQPEKPAGRPPSSDRKPVEDD